MIVSSHNIIGIHSKNKANSNDRRITNFLVVLFFMLIFTSRAFFCFIFLLATKIILKSCIRLEDVVMMIFLSFHQTKALLFRSLHMIVGCDTQL